MGDRQGAQARRGARDDDEQRVGGAAALAAVAKTAEERDVCLASEKLFRRFAEADRKITQVRDRNLRAEAAWLAMAERQERVDTARVARESAAVAARTNLEPT